MSTQVQAGRSYLGWRAAASTYAFFSSAVSTAVSTVSKAVQAVGEKALSLSEGVSSCLSKGVEFARDKLFQKLEEKGSHKLAEALDARLEKTLEKLEKASLKERLTGSSQQAHIYHKFYSKVANTLDQRDSTGKTHSIMARILRTFIPSNLSSKKPQKSEKDEAAKLANRRENYDRFMQHGAPILRNLFSKKKIEFGMQFVLEEMSQFIKAMQAAANKKNGSADALAFKDLLLSSLGKGSLEEIQKKGVQLIEKNLDKMSGLKYLFTKRLQTLLWILSFAPNPVKKIIIEAILKTLFSSANEKLSKVLLPILSLIETTSGNEENLKTCLNVLLWSTVPELLDRLLSTPSEEEMGQEVVVADLNGTWEKVVDDLIPLVSEANFKETATLKDVHDLSPKIVDHFEKISPGGSVFYGTSKTLEERSAQELVGGLRAYSTTLLGDSGRVYDLAGRVLKSVKPERYVSKVSTGLIKALDS